MYVLLLLVMCFLLLYPTQVCVHLVICFFVDWRSAVRVNDLEVLYPPVPVKTVRQAKNAAATRLAGRFGTKEGSAKIVYGSYGDGDLQV